MKSKEELDKMSKPEKIEYLLAVSEDSTVACVVREMAAMKAVMLL